MLSDLYRRYSPVISQAVTMCVCLPSCPGHSRVRQGRRWRFRVTQASLVWILQFPEILPIRKFFPGNGKFLRDPGKSSPVNIPSYSRWIGLDCIVFSQWTPVMRSVQLPQRRQKTPKDNKRHFLLKLFMLLKLTPLCCVHKIKVKRQIALLLFAYTYTSKIIVRNKLSNAYAYVRYRYGQFTRYSFCRLHLILHRTVGHYRTIGRLYRTIRRIGCWLSVCHECHRSIQLIQLNRPMAHWLKVRRKQSSFNTLDYRPLSD